MIIDYQNQEQMKELNFRIVKEYGHVLVCIEEDFEGVTFRNFPTIMSDGANFENCIFEDMQAVDISDGDMTSCMFSNIAEIRGNYTDFIKCKFSHCCSQGAFLTLDNVGSIEGCVFEGITAQGEGGYIIYSVYGKKKDVREIKNCQFIGCEVENAEGDLIYCCYFRPLSSYKTIDIDNVDYESCDFRKIK